MLAFFHPLSSVRHTSLSGQLKRTVAGFVLVGVASILLAPGKALAQDRYAAQTRQEVFLRGDANLDGRVSLADVFMILRYLHQGGVLQCLDAADTNDSGAVGPEDFLFLLGTLFLRHSLPPLPYPEPGNDPTDDDGLACQKSLPLETDHQAKNPSGGGGGENPCEDMEGGADLEFIHFYGGVCFAFPGEEGIRVPVLIRSAWGELAGVTLSLHAPPEILRLDRIDFSGTWLDQHRTRASWERAYTGARDDGFLAATYALDLGEGRVTLPPVYDLSIAFVTFSIEPDAPVGTEVVIEFRESPGDDGLPSIPNELVRRGQSEYHRRCGLRVHIRPPSEFVLFVRGDVNRDESVNITDAVEIFRHLYEPHPLGCVDAADIDDNGILEITDAIGLVRFLFFEGPSPRAPFPLAGQDSYLPDTLGCEEAL